MSLTFFWLSCMTAVAIFNLTLSQTLCSQSSGTMTLTLLEDAPSKYAAACLDGSPPGYYWREGRGEDKNKFLVVFNGGGWCTTLEDCADRAKTSLGTSTKWSSTIEGQGITSNDTDFNPTFATWSVAYIYYCDGTSFSGNRNGIVRVHDMDLHFRGKNILIANFRHLLDERGMDKADEVVLSGHSAGGLATYLHADYVADMLSKETKFSAVPDAGFFLDIPDIHGNYSYRSEMQNIMSFANTTAALHPLCLVHYSSEPWHCMFAQYTFPFIKTRLHVIQSQYDSWQLPNILHLSCLPPQCSGDDMKKFQGFRKNMVEALTSAGVLNRTDLGMWSDTCVAHSQAYYGDYFNNTSWEVPSSSGVTLVSSIDAWQAGSTIKHVDDCEWPCNSGCAKAGDLCSSPHKHHRSASHGEM